MTAEYQMTVEPFDDFSPLARTKKGPVIDIDRKSRWSNRLDIGDPGILSPVTSFNARGIRGTVQGG